MNLTVICWLGSLKTTVNIWLWQGATGRPGVPGLKAEKGEKGNVGKRGRAVRNYFVQLIKFLLFPFCNCEKCSCLNQSALILMISSLLCSLSYWWNAVCCYFCFFANLVTDLMYSYYKFIGHNLIHCSDCLRCKMWSCLLLRDRLDRKVSVVQLDHRERGAHLVRKVTWERLAYLAQR